MTKFHTEVSKSADFRNFSNQALLKFKKMLLNSPTFNIEVKKISLLNLILKRSFLLFAFALFILLSSLSPCLSGQSNLLLSDEWKLESQREEITPLYYINKELRFRNFPVHTLSGGSVEYSNGCLVKVLNVNPGKYYRFRLHFLAENIKEPGRSVLARILWMDESNNQLQVAEYPGTLREKSPEGWNIIEQVYQIPLKAYKAKIELVYRWDADGKVHFSDCSFVETDEHPSRIVRISTIYHYPRKTKDKDENIEQFSVLIDKAGKEKADIVCLPEAMTMAGTGLNYVSASEPVPGPSTNKLGEIARRNNLYIVAGLLEREGPVVYNTAVLIDRNGALAGKYRKVSLPREEIDGGVSPGNEFPVFDTDFGRIGMMICWDVSFPEVARELALRGAEVILMPIWGGNLTLAKARAIENQIYLVSSGYDFKSAIFDYMGDVLVEATVSNKVVSFDIDLNKQILWPWLGDFKNRIPRELPAGKEIKE